MTKKLVVVLTAGMSLVAGACSRMDIADRHAPDSPSALAAAIESAVVGGDRDGFLALVSDSGLVCGDSSEPKAALRAQLEGRAGLYIGLWDTEALKKSLGEGSSEAGSALSYRDFFTKNGSTKPTFTGGPNRGYLCWSEQCVPSSYLWRFEYARDKSGRYWIVGIGC